MNEHEPDTQDLAYARATSTRIGQVSYRALFVLGEDSLDRVDAALGVARRHLDRIWSGQLHATPAVVADIDASIAHAEALIPKKRCDHRFVDSKHCLKCGWVPPA